MNHRPQKLLKAASQRGFAILTAMIVLVVVATITASALWRQWQMVEVQSAQKKQLQASYVMAGVMDFVRLTLQADAKKTGGQVLAENAPWAIPIEDMPIADLLKKFNISSAHLDLLKNVQISVRIKDAQSGLNLNDLIAGNSQMSVALLDFRRLFQDLGVPKETLDRIIKNLNTHSDSDSTQIPLLPQSVSDLAWMGLSDKEIKQIEPYVVVLPSGVQIDVNTASEKVLYATVIGLTKAGAKQMVSQRKIKPFTSLAEAAAAGRAQGVNNGQQFSITSNYFLVKVKINFDGIEMERETLLRRQQTMVAPMWSRNYPIEIKTKKHDKKEGEE